MANERQWDEVPPVLLTANGTTNGVLQVTDTASFYFGMQALLKNNTSVQLTVYVKTVVDKNTIYVGPNKGGLDHNIDLSAFTVASNATLSASAQNKSTVPMEARLLATYETDPVDAWRVKTVDAYGNGYTDTNPFPVAFEGSISIGTVGIIGPPPDKNQLDVNSDGSINVVDAAPILGPTIENIAVPLANTEQFFTFPAKTQKFLFKVRDGLAKTQMAYVSGETNSNFITINTGAYYSESLNISGQSIYFQLNKPNNIIELLYWTQP